MLLNGKQLLLLDIKMAEKQSTLSIYNQESRYSHFIRVPDEEDRG